MDRAKQEVKIKMHKSIILIFTILIVLASSILACTPQAGEAAEEEIGMSAPEGVLIKCKDCNDCLSSPYCVDKNVGSPCMDDKGICKCANTCTIGTCCCKCEISN